jgi:hypothetical protein
MNPLYRNSVPANFEGRSVYGTGAFAFIHQWTDAGFLKSKLGVGTSAWGYIFKGTDTLYSTYTSTLYTDRKTITGLLGVGGTQEYFPNLKSSAYVGTATGSYASFLSTNDKFLGTFTTDTMVYNFVYEVSYGGYAGIMMYDLAGDKDATYSKGAGRYRTLENYGAKLSALALTDTTITISSGDGQTNYVSSAITDSLKVIVKIGSNPKDGLAVAWTITSTPAGATGQTRSPTSVNTTAGGYSATKLTLGDKTGTYQVTATITATGATAIFNATANSVPIPSTYYLFK